MKKKSIFLLAHQDDEIGISKVLSNELESDNEVICIFITDGGEKSDIRNQESLYVLGKIGVNLDNIIFLGKELNFKDGALSKSSRSLKDWLSRYIKKNSPVSSIYVPAYEGGHQDHDALHVAALNASHENGLVDNMFQFPLYNRYKCIGPFFCVMRPLPSNGKIIKINMTIRDRIKTLFYCLKYPSQLKTWIILFPFFIFYFLLNSYQVIQKVDRKRIFQKPHNGILLYEYRKFYDWDRFQKDMTN